MESTWSHITNLDKDLIDQTRVLAYKEEYEERAEELKTYPKVHEI